MADRDDVSLADEQVRLAEGDALVLELRGARHDEQRVAILLDLRPLMRVIRVLDREVVQLELPLQAAQQRHVGFVQADPHHVIRLVAPACGLVDRNIGDASALDIDACRDHAIGVDGRGGCEIGRSEVHGHRSA